MGKREKTYSIELTEEEMQIVSDVFNELTNESLAKWTTLIPPEGEYRSQECFQQWLATGQLQGIRAKISSALESNKNFSSDGKNKDKGTAGAYEVFFGFL